MPMSVKIPLWNKKYNSAYGKSLYENICNGLRPILDPSNKNDLLLQNNQSPLNFKITGHKVEVLKNSRVCKTFYFESGSYYTRSKKIFYYVNEAQSNRIRSKVILSDDQARNLRKSIKQLVEYASDLNVVSIKSVPMPTNIETAEIKLNRLQQVEKWFIPPFLAIAYVALDISGIVRNSMGAILGIGTLLTNIEWFAETVVIAGKTLSHAAVVFGTAIAAIRVVHGALSLVIGIYKLYSVVKTYIDCKKAHDIEGQKIAKLMIAGAIFNILSGAFYVGLGLFFLTCPQVIIVGSTAFMAYSILSWILTYGIFIPNSFLSICRSQQTVQEIEKHRHYVLDAILNNQQLSKEEMRDATRRFLNRISTVSQIEKDKIHETFYHVHHRFCLPTEELSRINEKMRKKRLVLQRSLRIQSPQKLCNKGSTEIVDRVLKQFEKTISNETSSQFWEVLSCCINIIGLQLDIPAVTSFVSRQFPNIGNVLKPIERFNNKVLLTGWGSKVWGTAHSGIGILSKASNLLSSLAIVHKKLASLDIVTPVFKKIESHHHRLTRYTQI